MIRWVVVVSGVIIDDKITSEFPPVFGQDLLIDGSWYRVHDYTWVATNLPCLMAYVNAEFQNN